MVELRLSRRHFLYQAGMLGGMCLLSPTAFVDAGACPEMSGKKMRWIVPYTPGGGYDIYSRLITPFLEERLNSRIRVENVPGGGGRWVPTRSRGRDQTV